MVNHKNNITHKDIAHKCSTASWIIAGFSLFLAFGSIFGTDGLGTGAYTKLQEKIMMTGIYLCFFSPLITIPTAISSWILYKKGKYAWSFSFFLLSALYIISALSVMFVLSNIIK